MDDRKIYIVWALLIQTSRANKRPRGLDALLGHLLDKRISVKYKLTGSSAIKMAENLSQEVDTRSSKLEMHQITPNWRTLNSDKYSVCMKDLPLRPKFWSVSLYELWSSRYKVPENQNCTEWPQTKLEHLTSTLYALYTYSRHSNWSVSPYGRGYQE